MNNNKALENCEALIKQFEQIQQAADQVNVLLKSIAGALGSNEFKSLKKAEPVWLSTKEAADLLKVHRTTLWKWSRMEILNPRKLGGRVYYKESELNEAYKEYINEQLK